MVLLEPFLLIHESCQTMLLLGKPFRRRDFTLQLPNDQPRSPPQEVLRDMHVAEQVVAYVENAVSRNTQVILYGGRIATQVGATGGGSAYNGAQQTLVVDDLEERVCGGEKVWLACRHDDEVEEIAPHHVARQVPIEGVLHHGLRICPL